MHSRHIKIRQLMRALVTVATFAAAAGSVLVPDAAADREAAAGTFNLRASLDVSSFLAACPPGAPPDATCATTTGRGSVQGLGSVSDNYVWSFASSGCPTNLVKPLATTGRIVVAGKGEFQFALAEGARCVEPTRNEPQTFTITGGTGAYASATGSGIVEPSVHSNRGTETWTGTLTVPSLDFDTTPPTFGGASNKLVRVKKTARRAKVTYSVTASDAADGTVPVTCDPRSGSFFRLGRTRVSCTATDTSANTATASFTVTVRRR